MATPPTTMTCWTNCPNTYSVSLFGSKCPDSYPNATKPNCTPNVCWSNCPNTTSVSTYGNCPSGYPNSIKPTCFEPISDLLDWQNEAVDAGGGFDDGKPDNDVTYAPQGTGTSSNDGTTPTGAGGFTTSRICWSGCPNSVPVSILGNACPATYPYTEKPSCGSFGSSANTNSAEVEALLSTIEEQQDLLDQLMVLQSQPSEDNSQEIAALMALIQAQQEQLTLAQSSNQGSAQVQALENQLALLQGQLLSAQAQPQQPAVDSGALQSLQQQLAMMQQQFMAQQQAMYDSQKSMQASAGGPIPTWAIVGGVLMVGLIAFVATKK